MKTILISAILLSGITIAVVVLMMNKQVKIVEEVGIARLDSFITCIRNYTEPLNPEFIELCRQTAYIEVPRLDK